jgi:hypothetical protein
VAGYGAGLRSGCHGLYICPDLPGERLPSSAMFKAITGCDGIMAEVKYRDSFEFTPFARLLFSATGYRQAAMLLKRISTAG